MPHDLAETLRPVPSSRARREALREAAPSREAVLALIAAARGLRRRDPEGAARIARSALLVARAARETTIAGEAAHVLGTAELVLGRPRDALRRQRAAAMGAAPELQALVAIEIARALSLLGHESQARSALADARRVVRRGASRASELALIDSSEASLLLRLNRDVEALALYERARRTFAKGRQLAAVAAIDANRATAYANLNRFSESDRLYASALRHHQRTEQHALAHQIEYNRAYQWFLKGDFERAIGELQAIRAKFAAMSDERHVALCDLDLAEIYLRMDLPAAAEARASEAASALAKLGLSQDAARARLFLAAAERGLGRAGEARASLEAARAALRDVGALGWEAVALHRLAELDAEDGRFERGAMRANDAATRLFALGFLERGGRATVLGARLSLAQGDVLGTLRTLTALSERIRGLHAPWLRCELQAQWARALEVRGFVKAAAERAMEAVKILERNRIAVPADEHLPALRRQKAAIRALAIRLLLRIGGPAAIARAYRIVRDSERRLDAPAEDRRPTRRAGALVAEETILEGEIDALLGRMPKEGTPLDAKSTLRRSTMAADRERKLRECRRRLRLQGRQPAHATDRKPPRERIPGDVALVRYVTVEQETHAFVVTRAQVASQQIASSATALERIVGRTRAALGHAPVNGDAAQAAAVVTSAADAERILADLHDLLIEPLRTRLRSRGWTIDGGERLEAVPFQALLEHGRPIACRRPLTLAIEEPTSRPPPNPRRGARRAPPVVWLVTRETESGIEEEMNAIATLHPDVRVYRGGMTTGADDRRIAGAPWVHAIWGGDGRDGRAAGGEVLAARERTRKQATHGPAPRLWVLSGVTAPRRGSDGSASDPASRLLATGVQNLVTLDPAGAAGARVRFVATFYPALASGLSPAEAFGVALATVRAEFPHPRDWAASRLFGTCSLSKERP